MHALLSPRVALAALAVSAFGLAACGDDSGSSSSATTAAAAATTAAGAASTSAAATTSAAAATTAASQATIATADNATIGQKILVNSAGMTIYLFVPDGASTTSTVPDGIKANWPAVVADGTPVAGDGIDASKMKVEPQPDGTQQLSYNGHLLYTFLSDTAPGDAKGQDLGDSWYVLSPAGEEIG